MKVRRPRHKKRADHSNFDLPEHDLLYAILQQAYFDLTSKQRKIRRIARQWILSQSNERMSFIWVCDKLKLTSTSTNVMVAAAREWGEAL